MVNGNTAMLKMYIAVLDTVPDHMVPVLVAHTVLGGHLSFEHDLSYQNWLYNSFKKVVLKVNAKEFRKICQIEGIYLGHENSTLNGTDSCAILCPREEYPNVIKFGKMWKPNET